MKRSFKGLVALFALGMTFAGALNANPLAAQSHDLSHVADGLSEAMQDPQGVTRSVRMAVLLTALSLLPALIVSMTAFTRIIVVLSMIRHAFGMPETPPTSVLISLGLFLTIFAMLPTMEKVNSDALAPFMKGSISLEYAVERGSAPIRDFMLKQVRQDELKIMYEMSKKPLPEAAAEVNLLQLTPAFILNELRVAFQIGFVILLPFLLIDLVVSSILLSLGMLMVPPSTIALPIKVLMFVLVDGWSLILQGVLQSFG